MIKGWRGVAVALAALTWCASCEPDGKTSAAPPLVVCGSTLWASPAGPSITDVSRGPVTLDGLSSGNNIFLKLTSDCRTGAHATLSPPNAAYVVTEAGTADGAVALVILHPRVAKFDIRVRHANGAIDVTRVRLASVPSDPPTPPS